MFAGVLEFQIPWRLLGILLVVCETSGGQFNPFLDPSLNDISSHALDQCFCEVNKKIDAELSEALTYFTAAERQSGRVLL